MAGLKAVSNLNRYIRYDVAGFVICCDYGGRGHGLTNSLRMLVHFDKTILDSLVSKFDRKRIVLYYHVDIYWE